MAMLFSNRIKSNASPSVMADMPTANRSNMGFLLRWNMRMERREPSLAIAYDRPGDRPAKGLAPSLA